MSCSGTVKKWGEEKGFGFIGPDQGGEDAFVHRSGLPSMNHMLLEGQAVTYDMEQREGRMRACNVSGPGCVERTGAYSKGGWTPPGGSSGICPPGKTQGYVAKWMDEKGFGFIRPADGGADVFVLRSAFGNQGCLTEGAEVYYVAQENPQSAGKMRASEVEGPGVNPMGSGGYGGKGWEKGGWEKGGWGGGWDKGGWGGWDGGGKGGWGAAGGGSPWGGAPPSGGSPWGGAPPSGGGWGGGAPSGGGWGGGAPGGAPPPAPGPSEWKAAQDAEGKTYYYNTRTNATTWDRPAGFQG